MTTRLKIFNDALLLAGERSIASLSEATESRRLLDQVWNSDGVIKCLEQGQWFFATRTVQIDYDPDIAPDFGYQRAFNKPTDWVNTSSVCSDQYFKSPLLEYTDESGYWYADIDTIYVKYVSSDEDYGLDLLKWPGSFQEFVAAHFASRIVLKLTSDNDRYEKIMREYERLKREAKSMAAMTQPSRMLPPGAWTKARLRVGGERGNRSGDLY
jgi:hypothetical protein